MKEKTNPIIEAGDNQDHRPKRGLWAPGDYLNTCRDCDKPFFGDKRAKQCAPCAYSQEEETNFEEILKMLGSEIITSDRNLAVSKIQSVEHWLEAWKRFMIASGYIDKEVFDKEVFDKD